MFPEDSLGEQTEKRLHEVQETVQVDGDRVVDFLERSYEIPYTRGITLSSGWLGVSLQEEMTWSDETAKGD